MVFIKVCSKAVKTKDNRTFDAYFGYLYEKDKDGNMIDKAKNDKSIKIRVTKELQQRLKDNNFKFPMFFMLDDKNESKDYFITIDKYANGKPRLDKEGNKHTIMVIQNYQDVQECERKELTLDDIF